MKITSCKIDYADKEKNQRNENNDNYKSNNGDNNNEEKLEIKNENKINNIKRTGKVIGKDENNNNLNDYDCVRVGWIYNSKLNLPWKPILAAAGETSHFLDSKTGLIIRYEESWKSKPWDVVKRLFKPTKME